ncbi:MAG: hypothetical protein E7662_00320 [Ruminococcaceae bacterium]|nr:hypothetical protein [Oscillospiraceae bacterium]
MTVLLTVLLIAVSAAIIVLHALSVFGQSRTARISTYFSLAMHIILFTVMLLMALPMDAAVLIFLSSVLIYSSLHALRYFRKESGKKEGEEA